MLQPHVGTPFGTPRGRLCTYCRMGIRVWTPESEAWAWIPGGKMALLSKDRRSFSSPRLCVLMYVWGSGWRVWSMRILRCLFHFISPCLFPSFYLFSWNGPYQYSLTLHFMPALLRVFFGWWVEGSARVGECSVTTSQGHYDSDKWTWTRKKSGTLQAGQMKNKNTFSSVIYLKSFMIRHFRASRPHLRCISLRETQPPRRPRSFSNSKAPKCKPTTLSDAKLRYRELIQR